MKISKTKMANEMLNADYFPAIYEYGAHYVWKYIKTGSEDAYQKAKVRALNYMIWHTGGTTRVERLYANFKAGIDDLLD